MQETELFGNFRRAKVINMKISSEELHSNLKKFFGFDTFKGDQEKIMMHLIGGGNAFVLMPTGSCLPS